MNESEEITSMMIDEIRASCFLLIGRAGTGKSYIATNATIDLCNKEKHGANAVTSVFIVTCAYQQGLALKARFADVLPDDVSITATSLHAFMGVRPTKDSDIETMATNVRGIEASRRLDTMISFASYRQLDEADGIQLVILEEFFYNHLAAHVLLYLATRQNTYVIACGDPGQIGRDVHLPDGTRCHCSTYAYDHVLVPHTTKQISMIVLKNPSYRQSSVLLRGLSGYMEKNNRLPFDLQHTFDDYVHAIVPDANLVQTLVDWHRDGKAFYFVSNRVSVNQTCSAFIEAVEIDTAFHLTFGVRHIYLSRRDQWYETATAIPFTVEGETTPRYIPNGTSVRVMSVSANRCTVCIAGYDGDFSVVFSDKPRDDPIRPVRFKSYDLVQGETIDFNVLFHTTGTMSPGAIYVAMTRATDISFFHCSSSFKRVMIEYAKSQELINHPRANMLYDMVTEI